jgi:hypothetical protein
MQEPPSQRWADFMALARAWSGLTCWPVACRVGPPGPDGRLRLRLAADSDVWTLDAYRPCRHVMIDDRQQIIVDTRYQIPDVYNSAFSASASASDPLQTSHLLLACARLGAHADSGVALSLALSARSPHRAAATICPCRAVAYYCTYKALSSTWAYRTALCFLPPNSLCHSASAS